jgi:phosphatidate cytidylyltransferase
MALHLPTFFKRLGSAIVFCAVMLTGLLWNDWAFLGLVCLIHFLCIREYFRIMHKISPDTFCPGAIPAATHVTGLMIIIPGLFYHHLSDPAWPQWPMFLWDLLPAIPVSLLLVGVLSKKSFLPAVQTAAGGVLYITLPMLLLLSIRMQDMLLPIILILMIWSNDTLAYLVGSFIGKTPFSSISPKKTWEGTAGGALLTIAASCIAGYYIHTFRMMDWIAFALCATVAGTLGDLLESKLKRLADVKDSGTIMPGHGGALDRFDSLLVAAPFAFVYMNYFMR